MTGFTWCRHITTMLRTATRTATKRSAKWTGSGREGDADEAVPAAANDLNDVVGPFWTDQDVTRALGGAADPRRVLTLTTSDGISIYPTSQFLTQNGQTQVAPGIAAMLPVLSSHSTWAVAVLLETPAAELGGYTPLQWVNQDGPTQALLALAHQIDREWSAGSVPTD